MRAPRTRCRRPRRPLSLSEARDRHCDARNEFLFIFWEWDRFSRDAQAQNTPLPRRVQHDSEVAFVPATPSLSTPLIFFEGPAADLIVPHFPLRRGADHLGTFSAIKSYSGATRAWIASSVVLGTHARRSVRVHGFCAAPSISFDGLEVRCLTSL